MDDIIEFIIEVFGELLEELLGSIKNQKIRKWALTVFYSIFWFGITGLIAYFAVALGNENNTAGTIAMSVIASAVFLVLGFFIIRGHRQNWKKR